MTNGFVGLAMGGGLEVPLLAEDGTALLTEAGGDLLVRDQVWTDVTLTTIKPTATLTLDGGGVPRSLLTEAGTILLAEDGTTLLSEPRWATVTLVLFGDDSELLVDDDGNPILGDGGIPIVTTSAIDYSVTLTAKAASVSLVLRRNA